MTKIALNNSLKKKLGVHMIKKIIRVLLVAFFFTFIPLSFVGAEEYPWVKVDTGNVWDIYYDSSSGSVYAVTEDRGVLRSDDTGVTWVAKNNGIDIFPEDAWRLKKISGDGNGHIFLATQGSYFYRSSDGGNTWQKATATGLTVTGNPVSMTFDSYTNKLFVTWNGDGVFRSADLGETWERINSDTDYVYSIYAGKADASGTTGMLLTGTYYNGIMKSTDGGDNWVRKSWTYWITDIISGPNDWLFAISTGAPNHIERSKDFGESWETVLSYT
ncbi:MAG TPA: YCF48-related protein [Smithella sp.]|nr:YCF48-related protein [Smithella sp.]